MISRKTHFHALTGLAHYLVNERLLNPEMAVQSQQYAKQQHVHLISYLVNNKILTSSQLLENFIKHFDLPIFDLTNLKIINKNILNNDIIKRYHVIPIKIHNNHLQIGLSDPTDRSTTDAIAFYTRLSVSAYLVDEEQLQQTITTHFLSDHDKKLDVNLLNTLSIESQPNIIQENPVNYDEPLIRFVDHLINNAIQQKASDIHIETYEIHCRIRYRQDGILYTITEIPNQLAARLITRLKIMAKLDITERRIPQDGRFRLFNVDVRLNSCPTLSGEKVVLRILDPNQSNLVIDELGFLDWQKNIFFEKISQPQGLILVTGPTGSGKTVTLYSALNHLNTSEKNISTAEDPIEIKLNGINQVNINPKINFNFSTALRAFLRQDPDIIMIGEIRDAETAEIAVQAAQTGHLVLSTLHANSALEALLRLKSMQIEPHHIINSLTLIIAQRLIRKLCAFCKQFEAIPNHLIQELTPQLAPNAICYRATGCKECQQGYQGRTGIYEVLPISDALGSLMISNPNISYLKKLNKKKGLITLREAGLEKYLQGITSLAELQRVISL